MFLFQTVLSSLTVSVIHYFFVNNDKKKKNDPFEESCMSNFHFIDMLQKTFDAL